jgi:hypothetical protein
MQIKTYTELQLKLITNYLNILHEEKNQINRQKLMQEIDFLRRKVTALSKLNEDGVIILKTMTIESDLNYN